MDSLLKKLGLEAINDGTWCGSDSSSDDEQPLIESINPATGEVIASVRATSADEYEKVIAMAEQSFGAWRVLPAPARGEAVRRIGNALRRHKDALGSLVSLEMG
ncbi:MAG: aldehyde dehydrogenase family protein, partial [Gammaproteobacteria bacterium]